MNAKVWGALAASASLILAAFGVSDPNLAGAVQGVIAGGAALVTIVSVVQHHMTTRNADTAAAQSVRPLVVSPSSESLAASLSAVLPGVLSLVNEIGRHDAPAAQAPAPAPVQAAPHG